MSIYSVAAPSDAVLSRTLDEELIELDDDMYADFIIVESESSDDDYYELPLWIAMLGVFVLAVSIAAFVFFLSYKHESICGKHADKKAENKEDDEIVSQLEKGETPRVSTKKFNDPNVHDMAFNGSFHTHNTGAASVETEESSLGSGSDSTSQQHHSVNGNSVRSASTTNSRKSLVELITEPRCVLCSVTYEEGEDVTRSENPRCHHEYHTECLLKHWTKTKDSDKKCPVCKERYSLEASC